LIGYRPGSLVVIAVVLSAGCPLMAACPSPFTKPVIEKVSGAFGVLNGRDASCAVTVSSAFFTVTTPSA
jgi:hypothetical protein